VNCQLYSGWRPGKCKPGIVPDGEGLVEAAGESIKVGGIGVCGGVGVGSGEGDSTSVVNLRDEAIGEEAVEVSEGRGSDVGKGSDYATCKGVGNGLVLVAKKHLKAKGRDDGGVISLSPSLAIAEAEVLFGFFFFVPGPEPAACA